MKVGGPPPAMRAARLAAFAALPLAISACVEPGGTLVEEFLTIDLTDWTLAWSDEFEGPGLDAAKWVPEIGNGSGGWGNGELQYYTARPENLAIVEADGASALRIAARAEAYKGFAYTSARIKTERKFSFQYGRAEARIRLPAGQGLWPAFWMLGDSIDPLGWPECGEIDILEMKGGISDDTVSGTIHYKNASGYHQYTPPGEAPLPSGVFADGWHVFGVDWNAERVLWYLDGEVFHRESVVEADREEFRSGPFFLILNLAVGGQFLGYQTPPSGFASAEMLVDWVRVYQKP
ncbi:MAG: glycoside hydrolase family 16 protein [Spirochaetales bacterium]|nr:glycoside hydrolase family 16 protein [Spirochaetales bacterium]